MKSENLVDITSLHYAREKVSIFSGVDMHIRRGKITAIMGPSGCGKTTLLRLMTAGLYPDKGTVLLDGLNVHQLSRQSLYRARQKIGLLFQSGALFTDLNVFENVAFPLREHTQLSDSLIRDIVLMKLEAVGLRGAFDLMPSSLSGGMARRVALARSVALDPELMLFDEPFTGQDPISMGMLVSLIKNLNTLLGITTVIVSHDVTETLAIADEVYILSQGKVIAHASPEELRSSDDPAVKQFIQGLSDGVVPFHYPAGNYVEDLLDA